MATVRLFGFAIETTSMVVEERYYRQAIADDRLDHELDAYLSDMGGENFVYEKEAQRFLEMPSGGVADPEDVLSAMVPILNLLPMHVIGRYLEQRRTEEK